MDVRSLIYLRLAKESSGILLRLSLELAKYNMNMKHVESDVGLNLDPNRPKLTKQETADLIKRLTTKEDFALNQREIDLIKNNGKTPTKKYRKSKNEHEHEYDRENMKMLKNVNSIAIECNSYNADDTEEEDYFNNSQALCDELFNEQTLTTNKITNLNNQISRKPLSTEGRLISQRELFFGY